MYAYAPDGIILGNADNKELLVRLKQMKLVSSKYERMEMSLHMDCPSSITNVLLEIRLTTSPDYPDGEKQGPLTYLVNLKPKKTSSKQ